MNADGMSGAALSRAYFQDLVRPALLDAFPALRFAAGRFGTGSDVLGLDDATSRDHDWGLRLSLVVPDADVRAVAETLERHLPDDFLGHPTRFAFTGRTEPTSHIEVCSAAALVGSTLGFDPRHDVSVADWLSLSGQAVLEMTAGPVFEDGAHELSAVRAALEWYPDDVWRYVLACDWARLAQEMPSMRRSAEAGDELGSRVIAARLVHVTMHLGYLLERRWSPYAKWFGTMFHRLPHAAEAEPHLEAVLGERDGAARERALIVSLQHLLELQNAIGLTDVRDAAVPFWDRPSSHPDPAIAEQLLSGVTDPAVRGLRLGLGSAEQRTDNVDVLVDPRRRRALLAGTDG